MKIRIISILLAVTLLITGMVWCQAQTTLGDVNGDGKINAADALLILKYSVGKIKLKEEAKQAADTTGSHDLSAKDALCILQKAVGSIRHFPAEITEVAFNKWDSDDKDAKHCFYAKQGANDIFIGWAMLCNTYEEYLAFLDGNMIAYDSGEPEEQKQRYTALYSPDYFETNSLLLFTVKPSNSQMRAYVNWVYAAGSELNVQADILYPPFGPFDAVIKLYHVELQGKTNTITDIHFDVHYNGPKYQVGSAELLDVNTSYDFRLK